MSFKPRSQWGWLYSRRLKISTSLWFNLSFWKLLCHLQRDQRALKGHWSSLPKFFTRSPSNFIFSISAGIRKVIGQTRGQLTSFFQEVLMTSIVTYGLLVHDWASPPGYTGSQDANLPIFHSSLTAASKSTWESFSCLWGPEEKAHCGWITPVVSYPEGQSQPF